MASGSMVESSLPMVLGVMAWLRNDKGLQQVTKGLRVGSQPVGQGIEGHALTVEAVEVIPQFLEIACGFFLFW
jgi:hypothetical protein